MTRLRGALRLFLLGAAAFLAVSAVPGGIALVAGLGTPPAAMLGHSIFSSFLVPGLTLLVVVGGSASVAAVLLVRRHRFASAVAALAGAFVMSFEFVEVLVIGSPAGPAFVMQATYFTTGLLLVGVSAAAMAIDLDRGPSRPGASAPVG
jgi:hypothetical protein